MKYGKKNVYGFTLNTWQEIWEYFKFVSWETFDLAVDLSSLLGWELNKNDEVINHFFESYEKKIHINC